VIANIILIGLSGTGKTSCAQILASDAGLKLLDTDKVIQEKAGQSVAEIFAASGEAHFRKLERDLITGLLAQNPSLERTVISVGGGLPTYEDNIDLLKQLGFTVFLNTDPATLSARLGDELAAKSGLRPLLGDGCKAGSDNSAHLSTLEKKLADQLAKRLKYYSQAHLTVSTAGKSKQEVCAEIQTILINHPLSL
jgi:shikimate kinase